MNRFKVITSVCLFLIKENKILLLRRKNTGYEDGNYGLPSGHVEDNEPFTLAMQRETKEEIGITVLKDDLSLVHIMHRKEKDIKVDIFFTTKIWNGDPINTEPDLCDNLQWFPLDNLPENTIGYVKVAIDNFKNNLLYSEIGWT